MISFFKTVAYIPLYNFFILILNIKWIDAGLAAVILTMAVKAILYPVSKKTILTQIKMKEKEGELSSIKEKYKDKQEQALKTMEFYKENKINPFSGILTIIVQIPVIFSLYYIFSKSGLPQVDTTILYPFIKAPQSISMMFLGFLDISQKSAILALLAALSAFWQMHVASSSPVSKIGQNQKSATNEKEDFANMMSKQMKYTMPVMVFFISWKISGVVALYWLASNLFSVAQEIYLRKAVIPRS